MSGITLSNHDIRIEEMTSDVEEKFASAQVGVLPPKLLDGFIQNLDRSSLEQLWQGWSSFLFSDHRENRVPIFETEPVEYNGETRYRVKTQSDYGYDNRTVLQYSKGFDQMVEKVGKSIAFQYALDTGKATNENDRFFSPSELEKVIEYVEGDAWVYFDDIDQGDRIPISTRMPLQGFLYMMYSVEEEQIIPRYIGIATKGDNQLNGNIKNIQQDSAKGRWGYGDSNHLGALSRACFDPEHENVKEKYRRWAKELFVDNERILYEPLYIDMLPWFDHDLETSEQNAVMLASYLYKEKLLNVEYAKYC